MHQDDPTPSLMGRTPLSDEDNQAFWAAAQNFVLAMVNRSETPDEVATRTRRQVNVERSTLEAIMEEQAPALPRRRL